MHEIETPDGIVEFPDEMSPEEITSALNKHYPSPQSLAAFSLAQGIGMPAQVMSTLAAGAEGSQMTRDMEAARERRMYGADVEAPISPATPEQLVGGLQAARGAAGDFMGSMSEVASDFLRRTGIDPSAMPGRNVLDITRRGLVPGGQPGVSPEVPIGISPLELLPEGRDLKAGIQTGAGKLLSGFTEPGQAAMLPFAGTKPVQAFFGLQAAAEVPESIKALYQSKTLPEAAEAGFGAAANLAMGGLIGRHLLTGKGVPNARSVEETAKVYGDLFPQPGEGERQVSAQESRAGVQPSSEAVAEAAQVPLGSASEFGDPLTGSSPWRVFAGKLLPNGELMYARAHASGGMDATPGEPGYLVAHDPTVEAKSPMLFEANELTFSPAKQRQLGLRFVSIPELDAAGGDVYKALKAKEPAEARPVQPPLQVLDADELLHPVEAQLLQNVGAAHGLRGELEVVENHGEKKDPNNDMPFRATLAETNPDGSFKAPGKITVSRDALRKWIEGRNPDTLAAQVGGALAEEIAHSFTTKAEAEAYLKTLTDFERNTRLKAYLGEHTPETLPGGFPEWQQGAEVLRQHVQELMRLTPNEFIERAKSRTAQWTKDGLYMLAKIVRRIREFVGTQAAEAGGKISYEILDRMERNVNAAAEVIGEDAPFMISREEGAVAAEETAAEKEKRDLITSRIKSGELKPENMTVTINPPMKYGNATVPGFVQVDENHPTLGNTFSSNPEALRKMGFDIPPKEEFFKLGMGRMKLEDAKARMGEEVAMPRRKEGREEPTLPGMEATKGKGVLTKPETAPAGERPPVEQYQTPTPLAVDKASYEHFYTMAEKALTPEGKAPSFADYAGAMRVKFGPVSTQALVEAFDRNMWPALMGLSGDKVAALRDKMNLRKDVGAREVSDPPQRGGLLKSEFEGTPAAQEARKREVRKSQAARQNYRNTVISAIGRKLTEETLAHVEKQASLTRTEVTPFDLWKPRDRRTGKMKQKAPVRPIYNELTPEERNSPALLDSILSDDGREMKAGNVAATKRLTVLQSLDPNNPKVEMVSTYRDPRRGTVLMDPQSPGGTHSPLKSILKRYRPIASVLLDDPVKGFRKSFDSLLEYENEFGREAKKVSEPGIGQHPITEESIEAVPIYRPEEPITRSEAMAIIDHVDSEVGRLDSPEDVKASLESLPERLAQEERRLKESYRMGKANVPTPQDVNTKSAASAYLKQMAVLADKFPDASVEELVDRLSQQIYENHKASANIDEFVTRTLSQGTPEAGEVLPSGVPAPVPGRVESVIPKLSVEPRVIPGGRAGAFIPKEEPSKMLSPEDLAQVKSQATPEYPASLRHILYRQLAQAKVPERPYTVGKDYTPIEREAGEDVDGPEEGAAMITRRDIRDRAEAKFWTGLGQIRSMFLRHGAKQDIATVAARASTLPINLSQEAKREIELWSASKKHKDGDPEVLAAARAINASYVNGMPDQAQLGALHTLTTDAQSKAAALLRVPTDLTLQVLGLGNITGMNRYEIMSMARQWLHAAEDLQKEVEYAQAHFGEQNLMRTTRALRRELNAQLQWERNHGRNTKEAPNYLPGLYKGEIYGDRSVTFMSQILGKQFGNPKTFANTYEAINAGPFIPKLNNVAEIAAHRIRSGLNSVMSDEAFRAPLHMIDPETGTPIAVEMELKPGGGYVVPKGLEQYVPVKVGGYGTPLAFRRSYAGLMEDLFGESRVEKSAALRGIRQFGAIEKHSTLAGDFYHLAKMMDFGYAVMLHRFGWKSGYGALEYRPQNMAEAVRRGLLRQKDMDWALTPEQVNVGGTVQTMTRLEISKFLQDQGLNVGRVQDAMYKHFVDELDVTIGGQRRGLGRYTRFLFDKFTRGIMNQAAVESFIRHNKALGTYVGGRFGSMTYTPPPAERIAKRIVGDINTMFGSAGKQALIKNPTLRDLSQLILLAPQWTGTRISMEARFLSRLATTPYVAATKGLPEASLHAGPIGRAVGAGLVMMFGITQAINLASRHQLTFQNPEEGHKLDAYIPDPSGGPGWFVSPLSIFMEMTHDVARLMAAGGKGFMETLTQIAGNKLHPVARGIWSGASGFTPTGQKITTLGGRAKAVATGMIPVPISASAAGRYIGHKVTDRISPNQPGAGGRQLLSTLGIKGEVAPRAATQIQKLADDFMKRNGLKPPTGWQQIQTDEPNYTKLRSAIRAGDTREARNLLTELKQTHPVRTDTKTGTVRDPVRHAMELYANHNFTSAAAEKAFVNSLTPGQKSIYIDAKLERQKELREFYQLYATQPR